MSVWKGMCESRLMFRLKEKSLEMLDHQMGISSIARCKNMDKNTQAWQRWMSNNSKNERTKMNQRKEKKMPKKRRTKLCHHHRTMSKRYEFWVKSHFAQSQPRSHSHTHITWISPNVKHRHYRMLLMHLEILLKIRCSLFFHHFSRLDDVSIFFPLEIISLSNVRFKEFFPFQFQFQNRFKWSIL